MRSANGKERRKMNYDKLYTRVNSNEHFHAIKLKELLVDNENKKEKKKIMMRGKDANGRRERKRITNSYTLLIIVN